MRLSVLFILLFILILIFGIDYYAFTGIKSITAGSPPRWRKIAYAIYGITTFVSATGFILLFLAFGTSAKWLYLLGSNLLSWTIAFFIGKLIMVLFLFGHDLFTGIGQLISSSDSPAPSSASRRKFISQLGLTIATLPFASIAYGILKGKYDYRVRKLEFSHADIPEEFDGFKIVQISDIHSGSFDSQPAVAKGIDMIMEQAADIIVFTGDLINRDANEFDLWRDTFAKLSAPHGMFSTLGNHDYPGHLPAAQQSAHLKKVNEHHEYVGFQLLNNEHVRIQKGDASFSLIGVENWGEPPFPQKGDLDRALAGDPDESFRILLSHDPTHWDHKVLPHEKTIHLTLSGHTHGMQFGVETKGFKWSPVKYRYPRWADRYDKQGQTLYVNRGFGFIGFSGRVGIWPEITLITLRKDRSA